MQPELSSSLHKSASCTSLDSGKESACDDHLPDQGPEKLTLCLKETSPRSPDSGASGSSESPPTEAAAVSEASASHPLRLYSEPPAAAAVFAGLRRVQHSIDEALSSASCVAAAVLSANEGSPVNESEQKKAVAPSSVSEQSTGSEGEDSGAGYGAEVVQDGVCDIRQKQTPDLVLDLPLRLSSESKIMKDNVSLGSSSEQDDDSQSSSSPSGPESPDMTTAAERFAKQNQCTLKKNTKASHSVGSPLDNKPKVTVHSSPRHSKSVDCQSDREKSGELVSCPGHSLPKQSSVSSAHHSGIHQDLTIDQKPSASSFKPPIKAKPQILKKPVVPVPQQDVSSMPISKDSCDLSMSGCSSTT